MKSVIPAAFTKNIPVRKIRTDEKRFPGSLRNILPVSVYIGRVQANRGNGNIMEKKQLLHVILPEEVINNEMVSIQAVRYFVFSWS